MNGRRGQWGSGWRDGLGGEARKRRGVSRVAEAEMSWDGCVGFWGSFSPAISQVEYAERI